MRVWNIMPRLSKSKLIAYRQCPKRLWLEINRKELREDSADSEARFQTGYRVGEVARSIYDPDGRGSTIDIETEGFEQAFARTLELLAKPNPIFEAGLQTEHALAFVDVLLPQKLGSQPAWKMVEVKSSTSVKDYHRDDVAVQAYLAQKAGLPIHSISLAHIDSSWIYPGGGDYQGLLKEEDLTREALGRLQEVDEWVKDAQRIAELPEEPQMDVGDHCYAPFECGFCNYCHRNLAKPKYPLSCLPRLSKKKRTKLAELGIDDARLVPDDFLNEVQAMVKEYTLKKKAYFDAKGAAADLKHYGLPAYFLDFETVMFAVPIWKGTRPYQQHVFQFSVHSVMAEGSLAHAQFLDLSGNDPCFSLVDALVEACGTVGPIYVYNATFETTRIRELMARCPAKAKQLAAISNRIVDLLPIARDRFYHPSQMGSWSIKAVLPAVVPELNYDQLEGVQDGGMAMEAFLEATAPDTALERKLELERQLLKYCELDTLGMVRLWRVFSGREGFQCQA
jgi:hypothetical protein